MRDTLTSPLASILILFGRTTGKPKVAASLFDFMTHPEWKYSTSSTQTAFQLAHNTHDSVFAYLKQRPSELEQWASSVRVSQSRG